MDKIRIRSGIELVEIQGVHLLVADRQAREKCRYIQRINEVGASIWKFLESGATINEIEESMRSEYEIEEDYDLRSDIYGFVNSLKDNQYIVIQSNNSESNIWNAEIMIV